VAGSDLVITGEGHLDDQSLDGKVVGGVLDLAGAVGVPVAVVAGDADDEARQAVLGRGGVVVTLAERDGLGVALDQPKAAVRRAVAALLG